MQRKLMYEQEGKAVSPSFRNSIPVQPPVNSHMPHNSAPSAYTTSYPDNVMYGGSKFPQSRYPGMGGPSNGSSPTNMHSMYHQQQAMHPAMNRSPMATTDYSNLRVTGAPNSMPPQAYPAYGMAPQMAPSVNGRIYQVSLLPKLPILFIVTKCRYFDL